MNKRGITIQHEQQRYNYPTYTTEV